MKKRWWKKYLQLVIVLPIIIVLLVWYGGPEAVYYVGVYLILPVALCLTLIFIVYDLFQSDKFREFNINRWWLKYVVLSIPTLYIILEGWADIPLDNITFLFSRSIFFGMRMAPWKFFFALPLVFFAIVFFVYDIAQYLQLKNK